ncbi:hypothetical protein [Alteromonas sp. AMM-1]|uniref:hypothetical protein n=1 Tax=Alteromonas sp. AMM-1 TaxID=3394233 RepID=UPI0039A689BC
MRRVINRLLVLVMLCIPAVVQGKTSLALFNLTPASIDAIGLDGDLLFSMRKELERTQTYQLLSRRQMEEGLYRIGGAQVADTDKVITYGNDLGVNFILTGTIDIKRATIIVDFKLVDVSNSREASIWQESFLTQGELVSRAAEIVESLERRIRKAQSVKPDTSSAASSLTQFRSTIKGEQVLLEWTTVELGPVFYYNLYRGESESGPFEFVESTTEAKYVDNRVPQSGTYFYRLDIILESGDEIDGGMLARASISKAEVATDVSAPAILSHQIFVNGVALDFVPSIANKEKTAAYQVYYRESGGEWQLAVKVEDTGKINYSVTAVNILEADKQYEFAVTTLTVSGKESAKSSPIQITSAPSVTLTVNEAELTREVGLAWQPTASEYGVKVYRREAGSANWAPVAEVAAGHGGQYTDTKGLGDGITYEYAITLYDRLSESARTNIVQKNTKKLPAPAEFTASGGVKSVHLLWSEVPDNDVTGYRIFRTQGSLTPETLLDELADVSGRTKTQFVDGVDNSKPLQDGQEYHYLVVATNKFGGVGVVSETQTAVTKPRPDQAGSPVLTVQASSILVSWEPSNEIDIKQYRLYRRWNNGSWQQLATVPASETQFADSDLKPYAQTSYYVVAEDKDGLLSDPSDYAVAKSPDTIALQVTAEGGLRRTDLSWSQHRNIDGYRIYRRLQGSASWKLIKNITTPSITEFSDDDRRNLADGVTYDYVITAVDGDTETEQSNIVSATTKPVPMPPDQFQAVSGEVKKVVLSWVPLTDPDVKGYKIYRKDGSSFDLLDTLDSRTRSSYADEGNFFKKLKDGTEYEYQIVAYNQYDAIGPASASVVAQTKPVPARVEGLVASESIPNVVLNWQANPESDIGVYQVYRGSGCSSLRKLASVKNTSYVDADVSGGRSYCYRVSAIDNDELEGNPSSSVEITTTAVARGGQ